MAVTLTDEAIKMVRHYRKERGASSNMYFRVAIRGGGCSGYEYSVGFDDTVIDDDKVFNITDDIEVRIDSKSYLLLNGLEIDYVDDIMQRGFKFNNPNSSSDCSCGQSFSV